MKNQEKKLSIIAFLLLVLAVMSCNLPPVLENSMHDMQPGLTNWKYFVNGELYKGTKYNYNKHGKLISIEFYLENNKYLKASYFDYFTIKDSSGAESVYRVCTSQVMYDSHGDTISYDSIQVIVVNNKPKIKSLISRNHSGKIIFQDIYEYDAFGRKISASRNTIKGKTVRYEYYYDGFNSLGVNSDENYFYEPFANYEEIDLGIGYTYRLFRGVGWCTKVSEKSDLKAKKVFDKTK